MNNETSNNKYWITEKQLTRIEKMLAILQIISHKVYKEVTNPPILESVGIVTIRTNQKLEGNNYKFRTLASAIIQINASFQETTMSPDIKEKVFEIMSK